MKTLRRLTLAVLVSFASYTLAHADEPEPSVDSLLATWHRASRDCCTLDAKISRWAYSPLGDRFDQGRFYLESPDDGFYQIANESFVWHAGAFLWITAPQKEVLSIGPQDFDQLQRSIQELQQQPTWWSGFWIKLYSGLRLPNKMIPLLLDDPVALRAQYKITCEQFEGQACITGIPKNTDDPARLRQWSVIIDASTGLPCATQEVRFNGEKVVHVLGEVRIDELPADRDLLFNPDLREYKWTRTR